MNLKSWAIILLLPLAHTTSASILVQGALVIDGSGKPGSIQDVRVYGTEIVQIGKLRPRKGDVLIEGKGLTLAPGFIDAHSHADSALDSLASQVYQGITTAVVGQDGYSQQPIAKFFSILKRSPRIMNFAMFSGHGNLRTHVMGEDYKRLATPREIQRMRELLVRDMKDGALGLSSGLEYDPGHYSNTEELITLAKAIAPYGGMYISHVRDEGGRALDSFRELIRIASEAKVPAQVSHIKVAIADVWGKSGEAVRLMDEARSQGVEISADVYPYSFWQSTITALSVSRDWGNPKVWEKALAEVGGASHVRLTDYSPNPKWKDKTLAEIETETGIPAAELIVKIVAETKDGKGRESVLCEAMSEEDIETFLRWPQTMICSDGRGGGSHPRSAGTFPRVLAKYVRERKILTLPEAVRRMTFLPAERFGLRRRGLVRTGMKADLVLFDAAKIQDLATAENPTRLATGMIHVIVNGKLVLRDGKLTGRRPGVGIKRNG